MAVVGLQELPFTVSFKIFHKLPSMRASPLLLVCLVAVVASVSAIRFRDNSWDYLLLVQR